jgi:hypothetical protein
MNDNHKIRYISSKSKAIPVTGLEGRCRKPHAQQFTTVRIRCVLNSPYGFYHPLFLCFVSRCWVPLGSFVSDNRQIKEYLPPAYWWVLWIWPGGITHIAEPISCPALIAAHISAWLSFFSWPDFIDFLGRNLWQCPACIYRFLIYLNLFSVGFDCGFHVSSTGFQYSTRPSTQSASNYSCW